MEDNWRYTAKSITKYNPAFRDENGHYKKNEWIGFLQIGEEFEDGILSFDMYLETEKKYVQSATLFFEFHECRQVALRGVEKYGFSDYKYEDKDELISFYKSLHEGQLVALNDLDKVVKLILRELLWAECFCSSSDNIVLRFSYDFYMFFNSDKDMSTLFNNIMKLGLYIY